MFMTSLPSRLLIWTLGIFKVFGTEIKIFLCEMGAGGKEISACLRMKKVGIFLGVLHTWVFWGEVCWWFFF